MKPIISFIILIAIVSCNASKISTVMLDDQAPVVVYKTTKDYVNKVPITLNDTKDRILSYPAVADLVYQGELVLPVRLKDGYLLDRRGINANSVFTSYTYEEYSRMTSPPSLEELFNSIIDREPFESMYHCGNRADYDNLTKELNKQIKRGNKGFTPLIE